MYLARGALLLFALLAETARAVQPTNGPTCPTPADREAEPEEQQKLKEDKKDAALRLLRRSFFYQEHQNTRQDTDENEIIDSLDMEKIQQDARLLFGSLFSELDLDLDESLEEVATQMKEYTLTQAAGLTRSQRRLTPLERVHEMLAVAQDPDCIDPVFDVQDPFYDPDDAVNALRKCKMLVLRNAYDTEDLQNIKDDVTRYLLALQKGFTSPNGKTLWGEDYHQSARHRGRWEVIFPKDFTTRENTQNLLQNHNILHNVLSDEEILGDRIKLHSWGMNFAAPDNTAQTWHTDDPDLFGRSSVSTHGIGGHDLPGFAVTASIPLLPNYSRHHGPTEFCVGTSAVQGLSDEQIEHAVGTILKDPNTDIETKQWLEEYLDLWLNMDRKEKSCPLQQWRSPTAKFGDVVFWDYQMDHRGGRNKSNEVRGAFYLTFGRHFYRDQNFLNYDNPDEDDADDDKEFPLRDLLKMPRVALPDFDNSKECGPCKPEHDGVLEEMDWLFPSEKEEYENAYDEEDDSLEHYLITNKDLGEVRLVLNGVEVRPTLKPGETMHLDVHPNDQLKVLRADDNEEHDSFSLPKQDSNQIVLDQALSRYVWLRTIRFVQFIGLSFASIILILTNP